MSRTNSRFWLSLALITTFVGVGRAQSPVRVGVVIDGPWERNAEINGAFEQEIRDLVGREFDVRFPAEKRLVGDWSVTTVTANLDRLLSDASVDIIIASGPLVSHEAGHRSNLPKPVIAPFIINQAIQEIPIDAGASGVRNLVYVSWPNDLQRTLEVFQSVVPFKRMAYIYPPMILNGIPNLVRNLATATEALGIQTDYVAIQSDVRATVRSIPDHVEAVYVLPLLPTTA